MVQTALGIPCSPPQWVHRMQSTHSLSLVSASSRYFAFFHSWASSIPFYQGTVSSLSANYLEESDVKTTSGLSVVVAVCSRNFSCLPRSTCNCQSVAKGTKWVQVFWYAGGFSPDKGDFVRFLALTLPVLMHLFWCVVTIWCMANIPSSLIAKKLCLGLRLHNRLPFDQYSTCLWVYAGWDLLFLSSHP